MRVMVRFLERFSVVFTLMLWLHPAGFAQADISGYWKFSVPNGGVSYLQLKQQGEDITSIGRGGPSRSFTGTFHNGQLHMEASYGPANGKRVVVYEAVVKGDKFSATRQVSGQNMETGTLQKVPRDEAFPPRLPLPNLRDLPDNGLVRTPPHGMEQLEQIS